MCITELYCIRTCLWSSKGYASVASGERAFLQRFVGITRRRASRWKRWRADGGHNESRASDDFCILEIISKYIDWFVPERKKSHPQSCWVLDFLTDVHFNYLHSASGFWCATDEFTIAMELPSCIKNWTAKSQCMPFATTGQHALEADTRFVILL